MTVGRVVVAIVRPPIGTVLSGLLPANAAGVTRAILQRRGGGWPAPGFGAKMPRTSRPVPNPFHAEIEVMKRDTLIVAGGRHPEDHYGLVNPPIYRGSTVLHKSLAHLDETGKRPYDNVRYGRLGTPTTFAIEEAMAALEGGKDGSLRSVAVSSGMAACTVALMAFVKAGDHVLITDSVYAPVRRLADTMLSDFGVNTTF